MAFENTNEFDFFFGGVLALPGFVTAMSNHTCLKPPLSHSYRHQNFLPSLFGEQKISSRNALENLLSKKGYGIQKNAQLVIRKIQYFW